ncbi:MAG: DNA polymerase III subunit beta [Candidatus Zipacnadales bacterium]
MLAAVCGRDALNEAVHIVARGVSGRSTQPVQNNIYLSAQADHLRLVATDLEFISLEALIPATNTDDGAVTVPARFFQELTSNLPDAEVELKQIAGHGLSLTCAKSQYQIRGMAAEDFEMLPPLTDATTIEMDQGLLRDVIRQTRIAVSSDDTRPTLTGALLSLQPNLLEVVATDTHRLALRRAAIDLPVMQKRAAIVSVRALVEVERILHPEAEMPVRVSISDNQVEFVAGTITVGSRLIEGQFPDYQKVIPHGCDKRLTIESREFEAALRRCVVVAREDAYRVSLEADIDHLRISAESPDLGQVMEEISAEVEGDHISVAFNARYLLDAISVINADKVYFELSGPLNPGLLRPTNGEDYIYVLMPMQR